MPERSAWAGRSRPEGSRNTGALAAVGTALGIPAPECFGGLTPEEKLERVTAEVLKGPVIMVGDGVNDAAALSAATVGIAVHGGAEASLAAADIHLARPGLGPLVDLLRGSRRMLRTIHTCLAVSLIYNAVAAALAATGTISPWIAAVLMPASSFTVTAIALGSRTFGAAGTGDPIRAPRQESPCP